MLDRLSAIRSFGPKALIGLLAIVALSTAACGGTTTNTPGTTSIACPNTNTLTGAGSTFINPLFSKWSQNYTSVKCGAQVTYQSVGSGAGINWTWPGCSMSQRRSMEWSSCWVLWQCSMYVPANSRKWMAISTLSVLSASAPIR